MASILGSIISFHLGFNDYGYLPKFGGADLIFYGGVGWRISLFPLLPESALFSLLIIVINFFHNKNPSRIFYFALGGYFLIFSGLRTSIILLAFFLLFVICMKFYRFRAKSLLFYSFNIVLFAVFIIVLSFQSLVLHLNNFDNDFINQLLFKSSEGIASKKQLYNTIARSWVWEKHLGIFMENPLFGVGTFELKNYVGPAKFAYQRATGSESFFTNMLARIGIMALFFFSFLFRLQRKALLEDNKLVFFLILTLMITMIAYGSFFVPYNFLFLICIGLLNNKDKKWL
ncbi:MAG: O-antigen ligase family protein [Bacteroidota bacterium]